MPRVAPQVDDADGVGQIETLDDRLSETERIASLSSIGVVDPEQFDLPLETKTTLDGFLLLDTCKAEFPEDVSRADVNGLGLRSIVAEDLLFFTGLSFLDMSDNQAPLGPLGVLPALKELDFQCNALSKLENLTGFDALEWLNLSFNCLVASDVEELAKIPRLRELYLANNWVIHLPPIMDHFTRLETLSLERNNINGSDIFAALAVAPRLKNLNMSHNKITHFPQITLTQREGSGFPALSYLNLAHNKIAKECDILALVWLRVLEQLVLYGNPLAHAAVQTQDKTKLIYNPVPNMTDPNVETEREVQLNIVIAYPDTKRRKPTYKNVAIARVAQAALPTSQEFKARGQRMLKTDPAATIFPPLQRRHDDDAKVQEDEPRDGPDATFLTGVGLEDTTSPMEIASRPDKFPHVKDQKHTEPAMPSYFLTRSLAPTTEVQQHKLKTAMSSLRYQLNHPLTSHNDSDHPDMPLASRSTALHNIRQRPRRHHGPEIKSGVLATIDRAIDDVNAKLHQRSVDRSAALEKLLRKANRLIQQK
ncbi:hypothetical protein Ae201684P_017959 [Aphanomyces euteiches]|nr:hypothetical protein Ae201684P_017959 [Aphanomyces euteiches]KAH9156902.1 hypothetical protein AeRB84_001244 [Aphanomyces euteiches]